MCGASLPAMRLDFTTAVGRLVTADRDWAFNPGNLNALAPEVTVNLSRQRTPAGNHLS